MTQLSKEAIQKNLHTLQGWEVKKDKLFKKFSFKNFSRALAFMVEVSIEIEKQNHHPEWYNVYNILEIYLTTHDAGGITNKDILLAQKMNDIEKTYITSD